MTARRTSPALRALERLEAVAREYAPGLGARKRTLLARLARTALPSAGAVQRLHEAATFLLAYPDDPRVHAAALALLRGFAARRDVVRFAAALVDSGIAGTAIRYRFFSRMAQWLVERAPGRLAIDWDALAGEDTSLLESLLPLFALPVEHPGLDEYDFGLREWLERMKRAAETDAEFVVRSITRLPASRAIQERLHDAVDVPMVLAWAPGGPTRTAVLAPSPARRARPWRPVVRTAPLARERPDLRAEAWRPPVAVRALDRATGERMVALAREAMLTRQRDLDAFANADPRDARLVEYEDGLAFVALGVQPADRLLFESVYGFITLQNRVPIGYVLTSALYGSCEIAYNVFDTFRGAEAALVYARVVAMSRQLFGADTFTIYPYQLGEHNDEAIRSGAWWFYYKLGFRPRNRAVRRLVARELARMRRDPSHRSSDATLRRLAADNLYFHLGDERDDVIGLLPLASVGLAATELLAARAGSDRGRAAPGLADEARHALGLRSLAGWNADERAALERWAPLVPLLGARRWNADDRAALAAVIRAKGGRRESEFVHRFDAHAKLRATLRTMALRATP